MKAVAYKLDTPIIFDANWKDLYIITNYWKSDLLFYKDDLKILDHLLDKYTIWLSKNDLVNKVCKIQFKRTGNENQCEMLLKKVKQHLSHLANLIENPFIYDSHKFIAEHQQLEKAFSEFVKLFRKNRKEVFAIIQHILKTEA